MRHPSTGLVGGQEPYATDQYAPDQYGADEYVADQDQYAPDQYAPEQYAPDQYAAEQYAPDQYAAEQYAPDQYAAEQYGAEQYAPDQYAPDQYAPDQYPPDQYAPDQYAPDQYPPDQYAPDQYAPDQYAPDQYPPDQYAPPAQDVDYQHQPVATIARQDIGPHVGPVAGGPGDGGPASGGPRRFGSRERAGYLSADTRRLALVGAFWLGLAISVGFVLGNTTISSLAGAGDVLTVMGRITGMAGGYLLLVQILLKSRVAWLEMSIGADRLARWHRRMGPCLLGMVLAHMAFMIIGLALTEEASIVGQVVSLLTTWESMVSAFVATGILVAVGLLGVRMIRHQMPYELWHLLHSASYLVLLLVYGHQFANGIELAEAGIARWYWGGLYAFVVASLVWGRVVEPVWLNLRHQLRVAAVVPESDAAFSVYIDGRDLDGLDAKPGQFYRWRFLTREGWWQSHPFSLSAAPNRQGLRLTIKAVGDHTRGLRSSLQPGTRVIAQGPYGAFTADRQVQPGALLVAGGSGIAPIRALIEEMPPGTVVIYRASSMEDVVFRSELQTLAHRRRVQIHPVLGSRDDPGPRRLCSPAGIHELVPDVTGRDVYLCGPEGMVSPMVKALRQLGVPPRQIHLDPFEF